MIRRLVAGVAVLVSMALIAGCTGIAVPDVKGKTATEAEAALASAGLKSGKVTYDPSGGAAGAVVAQDPAAGARVPSGSVVNLTVAGRPPAKVPALVGMTRAAAEAALSAAGLAPGSLTETYSATTAAGTVMSQEPGAGAEVAAGSAVAVVVSRGPQPPQVTYVTVPGVVGSIYTDAKTVIEEAGFTVVKTLVNSTAPADKVVGQDPAGGARVKGGASVTLQVSNGMPPAPKKVQVPNVHGMKLLKAQATIASKLLIPKHLLGGGDGMLDVGYVYKQQPAAGTWVPRGTLVFIYTWKGP